MVTVRRGGSKADSRYRKVEGLRAFDFENLQKMIARSSFILMPLTHQASRDQLRLNLQVAALARCFSNNYYKHFCIGFTALDCISL